MMERKEAEHRLLIRGAAARIKRRGIDGERRRLYEINGHTVREEGVREGGGEMGFSMEAVVVGSGWGRPLWQARGEERQGGREAAEAADAHEDAKCFCLSPW